MGFALKQHIHETDALCAECCAQLAKDSQPISFIGKLVEMQHDVSDFVFGFFGKAEAPRPYLEEDRLGPLTKPIYDEIVEPESVIETRTAEQPPRQIEAREVPQPVPYPEKVVLPPKQPQDWQKFLRSSYFAEKLLSTQAKPPKQVDQKGRYVRDWAVISERISPTKAQAKTKTPAGPHFTDELQESLEEQIKRESALPIVAETLAEHGTPAEHEAVEEHNFDPNAEPTFLIPDDHGLSLDAHKEKLPEVIPAKPLAPSRSDHPWRQLYQQEVALEEVLVSEPKLPARRPTHKHNHDGRTLCEECLIQMVSPGSKTWAEVRENALVVARAIGMGAKAIGIGVFGLTMFFASVFPEAIKPTTPEEAELLRKDEDERKKKKIAAAEADRARWEAERSARELGAKAGTEEFFADYARRKADTEQSRKEWDDSRAKFESERNRQDDHERTEENRFWEKYNRHVEQINVAVREPWWDTRDDIARDSKIVSEINNMAYAVERGNENPDKLRQMKDELWKSREDKNRKDGARDLYHGRFLDLSSRARKCFEQAQIANNRRDFVGRDNLVKEGEGLWQEAQSAMNQFRSV